MGSDWYEVCNDSSKWHYRVNQTLVFSTPVNVGSWFAYSTSKNGCGKDLKGKLLVKGLGTCVVVHKGYTFDGATCAPDFEKCMEGALLHDALYQVRKCSDRSVPYSFQDADKCFLHQMKASGFNWLMRNTYWLAVRAFGWTVSRKDEIPKGLLVGKK